MKFILALVFLQLSISCHQKKSKTPTSDLRTDIPEDEFKGDSIQTDDSIGCRDYSSKGLSVPINKQELICFDDVKKFLDAIPESMRNYYLLIHNSQSTQATSSDRFPRLIIYSPTGRTIIGITTDPADANRETVEFAQMDEKTGNWDFFSHNFAQGEAGLNGSESCMQCHGSTEKTIRPIWESYQRWPHALSSWSIRQEPGEDLHGLDEGLAEDLTTTNASLVLSPQGAVGLSEIYQNRKNSDRFHTLEFQSPSKTANFLQDKMTRPSPDTFIQGDLLSLPTDSYGTINIVFSKALVYAQALGINLKLQQHKDYETLLPALILSSDLCGYKKGDHGKLDALLTQLPYSERYMGQNSCFNDHLKLQEAMGLDVVLNYKMGKVFTEQLQDNEPCSSPDFFSAGDPIVLKDFVHAKWLAEQRTRSAALDSILKGIDGDLIDLMNRVIFQSSDVQAFADMKSGTPQNSSYTYSRAILQDSKQRDAICSAVLDSI